MAATFRLCSRVVLSRLRFQGPVVVSRKFLSGGIVDKYSEEFYKDAVTKKNIVVFMKGVPSAPMCGFSRLVVQILTMHGVTDFDHYNILEDPEFKEAVKKHSDWPTFPQVYVDGEFIGGSDVLLQLHQNGELVDELTKIGHKSALLDSEDKS
nr:glutaredoxin 5 [Halisarca dujardinii]